MLKVLLIHGGGPSPQNVRLPRILETVLEMHVLMVAPDGTWPNVPATPAHLLVFATDNVDPEKTSARRWLEQYSTVTSGLKAGVLFVGQYQARNPRPGAKWEEQQIGELPSDAEEATSRLLQFAADVLWPRIVVVDDELRHLPTDNLPQSFPIVELNGQPTWIVPIQYNVRFAERFQPPNQRLRDKVLRFARSRASNQKTRVLIDAMLDPNNDSSESRALSTEILTSTVYTEVIPVSFHREEPRLQHAVAALAYLYPGRVWRPIRKPELPEWTDYVAACLNGEPADVALQTSDRITPLDSPVNIPASAFPQALRIAVMTWLGDDIPSVLTGHIRPETSAEGTLLFRKQSGSSRGQPANERYAAFLPDRLPAGFLRDWSPGRLREAEWCSWRTPIQPVLSGRPLYTGPAPTATVACYLDLDNILYKTERDVQEAFFNGILQACALSKRPPAKLWIYAAGQPHVLFRYPGPRFLSDLFDATDRLGLFEREDFDRLQIHPVRNRAKELADHVLLYLIRHDQRITRAVLATGDRKLAFHFMNEAGRCEEKLVIVTNATKDEYADQIGGRNVDIVATGVPAVRGASATLIRSTTPRNPSSLGPSGPSTPPLRT